MDGDKKSSVSHAVRKTYSHPVDPNVAAVHIIYTEKPQQNEESYHIRTLTSVICRCIIKCFEIEVFRVNGIEGKLEA
ncbi:hypothetical protein QQ045_019581 [Rhodiola kirilowii]